VPANVDKTTKDVPPGDQNFEEIEIAEEELIDAYVRGELAADERQLLEKGLRTSPQLVGRLHFARLLADAADQASAREASSGRLHEKHPVRLKSWLPFWSALGPRPAFQMAIAAAALIVVIGGVGLLAGWLKLRRETQQLAEQQAALARQKSELEKSVAEQRSTTDQIRAQLSELQQQRDVDQKLIADLKTSLDQKTKSSSAAIGSLATLFLLPSSRSPGENKFSPDAQTSGIRLQLAVEPIGYRGFVAEVKDSQGNLISRPKARRPGSAKHVTITIPIKLLPPGSYSIQLSGISPDGSTELIGNYSFRVTPKE
jgi:negative regulator of sigma E activity/methionine-rich copper-binding protein CopC